MLTDNDENQDFDERSLFSLIFERISPCSQSHFFLYTNRSLFMKEFYVIMALFESHDHGSQSLSLSKRDDHYF